MGASVISSSKSSPSFRAAASGSGDRRAASVSGTNALKAEGDLLVADVKSLCKTFGIPLSSTYWRVNYEKNGNEIDVDFN